MQTPPAEGVALKSFAAWLRSRFAERLEEVSLFGSRARGEATEHSDVDVAVVVRDLTGSEAREVAHFAGDLLTKYSVLISPFVVSSAHMAELRSRQRRIASEIDQDAVRL